MTSNKEEQKTEAKASSSGASSWWSYLKEKSEAIVSIYKEDLQEFTNTLSTDTQNAIRSAKSTQGIVESKITDFFGLNASGSKKKEPLIVDRYRAKVLTLQNDSATYLTSPSDQADFENWKKTFELQSKTDEISELLSSNDVMQEIHTKLVPLSLSYVSFWEHYFYKLHKLNEEEDKRAALIQRATKTAHTEEDLGWEEDENSEEGEIVNPDEVESYLNEIDTTSAQVPPHPQQVLQPLVPPQTVHSSEATGGKQSAEQTEASSTTEHQATPSRIQNIEQIDNSLEEWE